MPLRLVAAPHCIAQFNGLTFRVVWQSLPSRRNWDEGHHRHPGLEVSTRVPLQSFHSFVTDPCGLLSQSYLGHSSVLFPPHLDCLHMCQSMQGRLQVLRRAAQVRTNSIMGLIISALQLNAHSFTKRHFKFSSNMHIKNHWQLRRLKMSCRVHTFKFS